MDNVFNELLKIKISMMLVIKEYELAKTVEYYRFCKQEKSKTYFILGIEQFKNNKISNVNIRRMSHITLGFQHSALWYYEVSTCRI